MRRRNLKSKANASRELAIGIIKERTTFGAEYILLENVGLSKRIDSINIELERLNEQITLCRMKNRYLIKGDISQLGFRLPNNSDI